MLNPFDQDLKNKPLVGKGNLLFYLAICLTAFYPCLFQGQAYFDNDLLAQFGPWRAFLKAQLSQGHFPLWNPYSLGGQPFFADLQNMMLYPFNYLTLLFSIPMGLSLFFFIHMFWAALGMHLWLKSWNLSPNSCRAGALLFACSGFFWLEIIHPPVLAAFAWIPWVWGCLDRLIKKPKAWLAFFTGLCFAMLFLCGSFQVTLGAFYGGLGFSIFRLFQKIKIQGLSSGSFKSSLRILFYLVWGALPLMGQLIPTFELSSLSSRNTADAQTLKLNQQLSLNPSTLPQFLFPRLGLKPQQDMAEALQSAKDTSPFSFSANWGYLGPLVLPLIFLAFRREDRGNILFWGGVASFTLLYCFGIYLPFYHFISKILPGLSIIRVPYRFLYLYVLAVCLLAALGFDQWQKNETLKINSKAQSIQFSVYLLLLALLCFFHLDNNWRELIGLGLGACALCMNHLTQAGFRKAAPPVFILALGVPLLLNGWADFKPGPSSNFDYGKYSEPILKATNSAMPGRVLFFNQDMYYPIQVGGGKYLLNYPQNAACALKIKNFGGYNPLMLQTKVDIGTLPMKPLIQLGALQGLLTQKDLGSIPGFQLKPFPPYFFYEFQKPLPLAYAPQILQTEYDSNRRLDLMRNPDFDLAQTALLSEPLAKEWNTRLSAQLQCLLEKDEVDDQIFSIHLDLDHLVVFCEVMYPGWKAFIDGQLVPLYTANHILRAVYIPSGQHQVEFRLDPDWWLPIRVGLALWLLLTMSAFLLEGLRRKAIPHA